MFIERKYKKTLQTLIKDHPAILVTGPRRIGKTTLVKNTFPRAQYLSLDDPVLVRQIEDAPTDFFADIREPLIIDEAQYAPNVLALFWREIQKLPRPSRFIFISTQNFAFMPELFESLEHCAVVNVRSLSFEELTSKVPVQDKEYIITGGFPELYEGKIMKPQEWYANYVRTIIEKDIRNMKNLDHLRDFDRFLRALAVRTGHILSYSDIAREVKIVPNTAKLWTKILNACGIIYLLEPCHMISDRKHIKSPKIYFTDTGLASYLAGIATWNQLFQSSLIEGFWETYLVGQWLRHFNEQGIALPPLSYWRTIYGDEVNLLVEDKGRYIAFESQISETPSEDSVRGFQSFQKKFGAQSLLRGYVACRTQKTFRYPPHPYFAIPGSRPIQKTWQEAQRQS